MQDNEDVNKGFASVGERERRNLLEITEEIPPASLVMAWQ